MRLFIGGLPYHTTPTELAALFEPFGRVESATVVSDRDTGRSKGFGFVEIPLEDEATVAVAALDDTEIDGRTIAVNVARPLADRGAWERDDDLLRRVQEAPQRVQAPGEFQNLLGAALEGTPTDELFGGHAPVDGLQARVPQGLTRMRFVENGLVEWLAQHPQALYGLTPRRFEELCAELIARIGFQDVRLTPESGDGGVDIYAIHRGLTGSSLYVIQCKLWTPESRVGRPALQQLWGVWQDTGATKAVMATSSFFTQPALDWRSNKQHQLELRDFDGIREWLRACRQGGGD
jgi:Restriction endonuclease/RNA recognition motif. (a.k.a. RRM, RBD, or RNP domain)